MNESPLPSGTVTFLFTDVEASTRLLQEHGPAYADLLAEHPRAFFGLHQRGVWYLTSEGEVYLPVGYEQQEPIAVSSYLAGR